MSQIGLMSGRTIDVLDPRPDDICIEDIAYVLSAEYRFGGHCKPRVSVAEHSIAVSRAVPTEHALWGLLHDAPEAYLRDLPRPIKNAPGFETYKSSEQLIMRAVCMKFGLPFDMPKCVHSADMAAFGSEVKACMNYPEIWFDVPNPLPFYRPYGYDPKIIEDGFLYRYRILIKG